MQPSRHQSSRHVGAGGVQAPIHPPACYAIFQPEALPRTIAIEAGENSTYRLNHGEGRARVLTCLQQNLT
jgi:hypothetical protein